MQDWLRQAMDDGANQQHGLVVVAEDRPEYVIDHRPDHVSLHVGGARRVRHGHDGLRRRRRFCIRNQSQPQ